MNRHTRRSILRVIALSIAAASVGRLPSSLAEERIGGRGVVYRTERRVQVRYRRSLGDISARITGVNGGGGGGSSSSSSLLGAAPSMLWQEFRHGAAAVGSAVTPCPDADYCSSSELAQPLENLESPWTFSLSSCMVLTVMEGYHSGQAVYHVADQGRVLGNTSAGNYSEDCWDDPEACKALPSSVVGRGSWLLTPGNHSLTVTIGSLLGEYPEDANDGGWFQLTAAACPVAPTLAPAPTPTRPAPTPTRPTPPACSVLNAGCPRTSSCCKGLVCRKTLVTSGPLRCLKCIAKTKKCSATAHCCTGLRCLPVRSGSTSKVCK